jgi:sodium/hydrogen exchanger-like protein 6/7
MHWMVTLPFKFDFSDCLLFGALISATDPVTTLAIFQDKNVDLNLYSMIFGESVLNDAVSIILVQQIEKHSVDVFNAVSFFEAIGDFLAIFFGSFAIGSGLGCANALLTKFTQIKQHAILETALFILISISSYEAAESAQFSGIVAILFCGVFQAHYTYNNLSQESQVQTRHIFHLLSFLSENFIFIYIGITMFTFRLHNWEPWFICGSFVNKLKF